MQLVKFKPDAGSNAVREGILIRVNQERFNLGSEEKPKYRNAYTTAIVQTIEPGPAINLPVPVAQMVEPRYTIDSDSKLALVPEAAPAKPVPEAK